MGGKAGEERRDGNSAAACEAADFCAARWRRVAFHLLRIRAQRHRVIMRPLGVS